MAYCEICDSNTCQGLHPLGGRVCESCGDPEDVFAEGLCRRCWRYEHETNERRHFGRGPSKPRCSKCGGILNRPFAHFYKCP